MSYYEITRKQACVAKCRNCDFKSQHQFFGEAEDAAREHIDAEDTTGRMLNPSHEVEVETVIFLSH